MRRRLRLVKAMARRDALVAASYPISGILTFIAGLFSLWMLFYLGKIFGGSTALQPYAGDYFRFAVVGTSLASITRGSLAGVARKVRESQLDGSLGFLLGTPAPAAWVIAAMCVYPLAMAFAGAAVYLGGAALLFGASFAGASYLPAAVAALAGVMASLGLGMFSAAMVLVLRRGDPFSWLLESASYLLSGVLYPVNVLPLPLQRIAQALPATHAIAAVRKCLLGAGSWPEIAPDLLALLLISAFTLPLGVIATRLALARVEREGTAGQA